jgi:hypothetical protein
MSIYDENQFNFPTVKVSWKQLKYPVMVVVFGILVLFALFSLVEFIRPDPLAVSLEPNPLDLTKDSGMSLLNVTVFNTSASTASNIIVSAVEVGSDKLIVFPVQRGIDSMAAGTEQDLPPFVVRPHPEKEINSGSYKIRVVLSIDGKEEAEEELTLVLKAV